MSDKEMKFQKALTNFIIEYMRENNVTAKEIGVTLSSNSNIASVSFGTPRRHIIKDKLRQ